ncbi:exocyst complex component 3-like [Tubulanus polymorphus]|uniref:exocyst complex component 3-like n=1 Tax=Tubulanus polymorphus TaxID=672921 RepID=UPI003DA400B3
MSSSELEQMEADARRKAASHVATLLQRPDQLEKVEQTRRRVTRKKASIEAMLKTAVQSQLDGVKTGLTQLQSALHDVKEIRSCLDSIDENYKCLQGLPEKLQAIKEENDRHSQLAAAMENLKNIFTVPEMVKKTQEFINQGNLLRAYANITDLEMSRDELFLELFKQPKQSPTDKNTLKTYFSDVEKLSGNLAKQLWLILQRALVTVRSEPSQIVTVLRIIEREERTDAMWQQKHEQYGFMPSGRPKNWRNKCFSVLEESVITRIEGCQADDRTIDKMWLVRHLEIIRQLVLEDLKIVVNLCEPCFPPSYDIIRKYGRMYHNAIGNHLLDLKAQGLEGNEPVSLMKWVNEYSSEEMMGNRELSKIDVSVLGPLIPDETIDELRESYLRTMRENFQEWMVNSLKTDKEDWYRDQEPDADSEGFYNTSLPIILIEMIEQSMMVAAHISERLTGKVLILCIDEMEFFAQMYKTELMKYRDKHMANRNIPKFYLHYMLANINNCQSIGDFIQCRLKDKYQSRDDNETVNIDKFNLIAECYNKIATTCCGVLLDEVFLDMNAFIQELFTRKWLQGDSACLDTICLTIEDYCQDFVHLKSKNYEKLIVQAQDRVLIDYLKAMFARKITFKNYDERLEAADKISREAEQMRSLFNRLTTRAVEGDNAVWDALLKLAEVIRLKDTSMLSLEISGLLAENDDLRAEQIISLVSMRGDINVRDARTLTHEIMGEDGENQRKLKTKGIFTRAFFPSSVTSAD